MSPCVLRAPRTRASLAAAAATLGLALTAGPALAQSSPGGVTATGTTTSSTATAPSAAPSTGSTASSGTAVALTKTTIKAVQKKLGLKADGAIGAKTRSALRSYQRKHDLKVTGRMDTDTLDELGVTVTTTASAGTAPTSSTGTAASSSASTTPAGAAPTTAQKAVLDPIAKCESGGDPTAVSPSGQYHGKYQFSQSTWEAVGGAGDPAAAPEAEQDARAARLLESQGPDAWPVCSQQAPASDDDE